MSKFPDKRIIYSNPINDYYKNNKLHYLNSINSIIIPCELCYLC